MLTYTECLVLIVLHQSKSAYYLLKNAVWDYGWFLFPFRMDSQNTSEAFFLFFTSYLWPWMTCKGKGKKWPFFVVPLYDPVQKIWFCYKKKKIQILLLPLLVTIDLHMILKILNFYRLSFLYLIYFINYILLLDKGSVDLRVLALVQLIQM